MDKNHSGHKYYLSNNTINKKFNKDSKSNINIIYEHSAMNMFGITKKYKI